MSGYPNPPDDEDALGPHQDVLDSGTPGRSGRWIAVAVVAVLALVGWNLLDTDLDQAAPRAAESRSVDPPAGWVAGPTAEVSAAPDHTGQLTFVDAQHGFLVQDLCSLSTGGAPCPRRILATGDGGSSWESRARIPAYAEGFYTLHAVSDMDLILIDTLSVVRVIRSFDGGRSWQPRPLLDAEPAPAPPGAPLVWGGSQPCAPDCRPPLSWIDPITLELHVLPTQPAAWTRDFPPTPSMSPDGDIVAASADDTAGLVSMSADGGQTWTETRFDVPLVNGQTIQQGFAFAAGGGRAYAFVQVYDSLGLESTSGFRTDGGGFTWVDLPLEDQPVWFPVGVLDGELISSDLPGRIFRSEAGATRWVEAGSLAGGPYLSQTVPDGPILATALNSQGYESHYLSTDLYDWTPIPLPGV